MADTYKCPSCGAALFYAAAEQEMKCDHCGNTFPAETIQQLQEVDEKAESVSQMDWADPYTASWSGQDMEHLRCYRCPSCGSEMVVEETTGASECVYCGNPLVMEDQYRGEYKPANVIPFAKTKEEAMAEYARYCRGKKLLPSGFLAGNRIEKITGVYVPFWLFNCDTDSDITYKATKVRSYRKGQYQITETRHYRVYRSGQLAFRDVPADGSSTMDDTLMESVEPFNAAEQKDFSLAYLAGYQAQRHDVPAEQCKERANARIRKSVLDRFAQTVQGYASVVPEKNSIRVNQAGVREVLMPVWLLNTRWKDKTYSFAMNGQTGRFIGNLPVSFGKAAGWFIGITAGIALVGGAIAFILANGGTI